jgi:hypothetical protein
MLMKITIRYEGFLGDEQTIKAPSLPEALEMEAFLRFGLGLKVIAREIWRDDDTIASMVTWETATIDWLPCC